MKPCWGCLLQYVFFAEKERTETVRCETVRLWSLSLFSHHAGSSVAWHLCRVTVSVICGMMQNVSLRPAQTCTCIFLKDILFPSVTNAYIFLSLLFLIILVWEKRKAEALVWFYWTVFGCGAEMALCSSGWVMFPSYSGEHCGHKYVFTGYPVTHLSLYIITTEAPAETQPYT